MSGQTGQQLRNIDLKYLQMHEVHKCKREVKDETWPKTDPKFQRAPDEDSLLWKVLMTFRDIVMTLLWFAFIVYAMSWCPWLFKALAYLACEMINIFLWCISWPIFRLIDYKLPDATDDPKATDDPLASGQSTASLSPSENITTLILESLTEYVTDSLTDLNHWVWGTQAAEDDRSQQTKSATRVFVDFGLSGLVQLASILLWLCVIQKVFELLQRLLSCPAQLVISAIPWLASRASDISCPNCLRVAQDVLSRCWNKIKQYLFRLPLYCASRLFARLWFYQSIQSMCVQRSVESYYDKTAVYVEKLYNKLLIAGRNQQNYNCRDHSACVANATAMNQIQEANIATVLSIKMAKDPLKYAACDPWFTPRYESNDLFNQLEDCLPAWHGLAKLVTTCDAPTQVALQSFNRDQRTAEAAQRTARNHSRIAYGLCLCTVLLAGYMAQATSFKLLRSQCNEMGTAFDDTVMASTKTPKVTWKQNNLDSLNVTTEQVAAHIHTSSKDMMCFDSVYTRHLFNDPHKDPHEYSIRNNGDYTTKTRLVYEYYKNQTDSRTAFVADCEKTTAAHRQTLIGYAEMLFNYGFSDEKWPTLKTTCVTEFNAHSPGQQQFNTSELDAIRANVKCFSNDPFTKQDSTEYRTPTLDDLKDLFTAQQSCVCGFTILVAFFLVLCLVFGIRELYIQCHLFYLKCRI